MRYLYRFFHLNLINLDPEELVFEVIIARKFVPILHIFAFWDFGEDACFSTGK